MENSFYSISIGMFINIFKLKRNVFILDFTFISNCLIQYFRFPKVNLNVLNKTTRNNLKKYFAKNERQFIILASETFEMIKSRQNIVCIVQKVHQTQS